MLSKVFKKYLFRKVDTPLDLFRNSNWGEAEWRAFFIQALRDFEGPKEQPADVANASLQALEDDAEEAYPGGMAQGVSQGLAHDPKAVEKEFAAYLPQ